MLTLMIFFFSKMETNVKILPLQFPCNSSQFPCNSPAIPPNSPAIPQANRLKEATF